METIVAAQLVRYRPPCYLIEMEGEPSDADDLATINASAWDTVDAVLGWPPYNAIIRVWGADGIRSWTYLALVAD